MEAVFLKLLNMSITASYLVLAVILARAFLKKAPNFITVILWGLVAVRLVCPFSIESVFSLIPSSETVPADIMYAKNPQIYSGISSVNTAVNNIILPAVAPNTTYSANPLQIIVPIVSVMWLVGIAVMLLYTLISYIRIRFKVREAVKLQDNIYECDRIATPFILGIIKSRIYLPSDMDECDREYVIAHERAHLARRDHIWKPLGFLLLAVYWFNPVLWLGYILLCHDIELACDEKVIKQMGEQNKKPYSQALINCSVPRRAIAACPLAFGETGVKGRIKSVLNYKKPALWIIIISVALSIAVAVCFMTNPKNNTLKDIENFGLPDSSAGAYISVGNNYRYIDIDDNLVYRLGEIEISRFSVAINRSEERDTTNTIVLLENHKATIWSDLDGVYVHFNGDFSEVWVNDGVKPTLTYKIKEPQQAKQIFNDFIEKLDTTEYPDLLTGGQPTPVADLEGLSLSVKHLALYDDNPYIEVGFNNESGSEYTFGEKFELYYKQDGEYVSCYVLSDNPNVKRVIADVANIISPHGSRTHKFYLSWFDLSKEGTYKFEIEVSDVKASVEFELKH